MIRDRRPRPAGLVRARAMLEGRPPPCAELAPVVSEVDGVPFRCDLVLGHAGNHQCDGDMIGERLEWRR